jgi:hypothetical protein
VLLDLDEPRTFGAALSGVDRVFLLNGYSVEMLVQSKTLVDAARKAGVQRIVHLGTLWRMGYHRSALPGQERQQGRDRGSAQATFLLC